MGGTIPEEKLPVKSLEVIADALWRMLSNVPEPEAMSFGRRVAYARETAIGGKMPQETLAEKLGMSSRNLRDIENDRTHGYRYVDRLVEVFPNRSRSWFLGEQPDAGAILDELNQIRAELEEFRGHGGGKEGGGDGE